MADDSGLILGLSEGIKAAYASYNDEKDRQMRIQNYVIDRKMKKATMDMQAKEHGLLYNDTTGEVTPDTDPNSPFNRKLEDDKFNKEATQLEKGLIKNPVTGKPDFSPEKLKEKSIDQNYKIAQTNSANSLAGSRQADASGSGIMDSEGKTVNMKQNRLDLQAHNKVVTAIKSDPVLKQRLTAENNINNALSIVSDPNVKVTPQQVHELQQTLRRNMGITGTSGVGEREETYIKTLGMNVDNIKQFLTGSPQDISSNKDLMQHFKDLAKVEKNNIENQMQKRLGVVSGGYGSMYKRRGDLKGDLDELIQSASGQFGTDMQGLNGPLQESPKGLINNPEKVPSFEEWKNARKRK